MKNLINRNLLLVSSFIVSTFSSVLNASPLSQRDSICQLVEIMKPVLSTLKILAVIMVGIYFVRKAIDTFQKPDGFKLDDLIRKDLVGITLGFGLLYGIGFIIKFIGGDDCIAQGFGA